MPTLDEIRSDSELMHRKMLRLFAENYPVVDWEVFKTQVADGRKIKNPFRRYNMIWFHIPSLVEFFLCLSLEEFGRLTIKHPFFRKVMFHKTMSVTVNGQSWTVQARGVSEL